MNPPVRPRARCPPKKKQDTHKRAFLDPGTNTDKKCPGCGKIHRGGREECRLKKHQDFNKEGNSWDDSTVGRLYKRFGFENLQHSFIRKGQEIVKRDDNSNYTTS